MVGWAAVLVYGLAPGLIVVKATARSELRLALARAEVTWVVALGSF